MNIKKQAPKLISILLSFSMTFSVLFPAYAAEAIISENPLEEELIEDNELELEDGGENLIMLNDDVEPFADSDGRYEKIEVNYSKSSTYFVTIPKTITLGTDKSSSYSIKVEGDIIANKQVCVVPVDGITDTEVFDFYMKDQITGSTKEDVVAEVNQSKFYWNYEDVASGYEETENYVIADGLSAGRWRGTFEMQISMRTDPSHIHNFVGEVTKQPTCTEKGIKTYTCDCGDSYTEDIDPTGHHFEHGECTDCGEKDPNHTHNYTEKITKQPTCTEKGEKTYTCTCGDSYTEEIPATGHNYEDGECTDCGEKDPSHTHNYTEKITKQPTCTEKGEKTYTCACGDSYTEEIPATGHNYGDDDKCTECGEIDPNHKHSYNDGVVTKEPTCTEKGEKTFTCSSCGHTYTEEIPAKGHNFVNYECTICGETDPSHTHSYEPYTYTAKPVMTNSTLSGSSTTYSKNVKWNKTGARDDYTQYYTAIIYPYRDLISKIVFSIDMPEDYEGQFNYEYSFTCSPSSNSSKNQLTTTMKVNSKKVYENYRGSILVANPGTKLTVPLSAGKNTLTVEYSGNTTDSLGCTDLTTAVLKVYNCVVYDGSQYHICNDCGKKEAHTFGEPVIKEATCTEAGEVKYTCSLCVGQRIEELPALGHHYVEGVCDRCGDLNLKLTTTKIFSASSKDTAGTENGSGHLDKSFLAGTYSDNIEITKDMVDGEYLSLDFLVRPPFISAQGRYDLIEGVSGSTMLQKYDDETGTWKTVYTYPISIDTIVNMDKQDGGYGYSAYHGILKRFQLEKGTYRIYAAFSSSVMCGSHTAHYYCSYTVTAELCQEYLETQ